jgi:UDP-N-acetylmuramate--alanine ligase
MNGDAVNHIKEGLESFRGSKRRSEILGEAGGVLFMDDYAHHPTAIKTTLAGLRDFYPERRLVVSFMSHTYTRTAALLEEFASAFGNADVLVLHKIYGSAREVYHGGVDGKTLFDKVKEDASFKGELLYAHECEDAAVPLGALLKKGDLFITLGAGDNWKLGKTLYERFLEKGDAA